MAFELPKLPYALDALEPHIDAKTMEIHHGKHHAAYTKNMNDALEAEKHSAKDAVELIANLSAVPEKIRTKIRNNAGGYVNHNLFWEIMGPKAGGEPTGDIANEIKKTFGDFAAFKTKFSDAAAARFGSGWAWLAVTKERKLDVMSTPNQDNPIMEGHIAILGLDVWEHAYYLKYQNKRADYVAAWWNLVNWKAVADKYAQALKNLK